MTWRQSPNPSMSDAKPSDESIHFTMLEAGSQLRLGGPTLTINQLDLIILGMVNYTRNQEVIIDYQPRLQVQCCQNLVTHHRFNGCAKVCRIRVFGIPSQATNKPINHSTSCFHHASSGSLRDNWISQSISAVKI